MEDVEATGNGEDEILRTIESKQTLKRKIPKYYDRQQQLELVLTTVRIYCTPSPLRYALTIKPVGNGTTM